MFQIISADASLVYPADAFSRSSIFRIVLDSASSFFTALEVAAHGFFWNFQKNNQEKQRDEV